LLILFSIRYDLNTTRLSVLLITAQILFDQFVVLLKGWGKYSLSTKTIILKLAAAFNRLNKTSINLIKQDWAHSKARAIQSFGSGGPANFFRLIGRLTSNSLIVISSIISPFSVVMTRNGSSRPLTGRRSENRINISYGCGGFTLALRSARARA